MTEANTSLVNAERNTYAVQLSEELEFLEELLGHTDLPPQAVHDIVERRDTIRQDLSVLAFAAADDTAEQGIPLPADAADLYAKHVPVESEPYDAEDEVPVETGDEDHEFASNRAGVCITCGQPEEACEEEP